MYQYTHYFNEGYTPPSGIDTISIWLHPYIINRFDAFHERGNNNEAISLRIKQETDYKTGKIIRNNYLLDIQAEAIDPEQDILGQVLWHIVNLAGCGIIKRHEDYNDQGILNYFHANFPQLFAIDALDFYFDFFESDIMMSGNNHQFGNTHYTKGTVKRPSVLKVYNRRERLRQKWHIPEEEIANINYPTRIEFSFRRGNCEYLHYQNIAGCYYDVFCRFLPASGLITGTRLL